MLIQFIPVDEVLFVFEAWTFIVHSNFTQFLEPGMIVLLFDDDKNKIGKVKLNRILPSRNLAVCPIQVTVIDELNNLKDVKFVQRTASSA